MDLLPSAFVSRDEASNVMAYANEETAVNEMMRVDYNPAELWTLP
jgi:hypothetical protein